MSLMDEVRSDLPTYTADVLALNNTTRRWDTTGVSVEGCMQESDGTEQWSEGRPQDTERARFFCDLISDQPPFDQKARLRVDGIDWTVFSTKRIPEDAVLIGAISILERKI